MYAFHLFIVLPIDFVRSWAVACWAIYGNKHKHNTINEPLVNIIQYPYIGMGNVIPFHFDTLLLLLIDAFDTLKHIILPRH